VKRLPARRGSLAAKIIGLLLAQLAAGVLALVTAGSWLAEPKVRVTIENRSGVRLDSVALTEGMHAEGDFGPVEPGAVRAVIVRGTGAPHWTLSARAGPVTTVHWFYCRFDDWERASFRVVLRPDSARATKNGRVVRGSVVPQLRIAREPGAPWSHVAVGVGGPNWLRLGPRPLLWPLTWYRPSRWWVSGKLRGTPAAFSFEIGMVQQAEFELGVNGVRVVTRSLGGGQIPIAVTRASASCAETLPVRAEWPPPECH